MRVTSAAKDGGGVRALWPRDVHFVEDLPADLSVALEQALRICSWQENLQADEMPPNWMWHLDWEIEAWFIQVKKARDEKYGKESEDEPTDWEENEHASRFR